MTILRPGDVKCAENMFRHHEAWYKRGKSFDVLDWKKPDTIHCWVRMVFDHDRDGTEAVYITGDLGEGVVYPTCYPDLEHVARSFTSRDADGILDVNEHYFLEKLKTARRTFDWDMDTFKEDLRCKFADHYGKYEDQSELNDFFEEYCDGYMPGVVVDDGVHFCDRYAEDVLETIFPDYSEWVWGCGSRLNFWIVCWLVAMRLAWEKVVLQEKGGRNDGEE